jgi:hypothetical protein
MSTRPDESTRVPLFGTWRNAYVSVVVFFLIDVALFYLFQRYFS